MGFLRLYGRVLWLLGADRSMAIGLAVGLLQGRWLRALLFGVAPTDPSTILAVAFVLLLVALFACWLPGWRATRTRALDALVSE